MGQWSVFRPSGYRAVRTGEQYWMRWQREHCASLARACGGVSMSSTERKQWLQRCGKLRASRTETRGVVARSVCPARLGWRATIPRPRPGSCSTASESGRSCGCHGSSRGAVAGAETVAESARAGRGAALERADSLALRLFRSSAQSLAICV